jgi:hypothetical protein
MRALDEQAARLRDLSVLNGGSDNWLHALALGTTLRSVHLAGVLDVDTAAALRRIDPAVPDAKKVRDVLEHLGDYELGVGDVQPPGQRHVAQHGDVARAQGLVEPLTDRQPSGHVRGRGHGQTLEAGRQLGPTTIAAGTNVGSS